MRMLFAATAALALAACGGQSTDSTATTNTDMAANDMAAIDNAMMTNETGPANMMGGAGAVTVTVNGVRANGGPVLVALQSEGDFAKQAGTYTTTVQPTATSVTATFQGVSPGSYAAAVVQDTDQNGSFTIGETGPAEPFGFSGTAQTGAPTFGPAAFQVAETGGTATVTLSGGAN